MSEFFGSTVEKIAYEKAGILKRGTPAIIAEQDQLALDVIEREAASVGAPLIVNGRDYTLREENGRLVFEDEIGLVDLPPPRLPGRHQHGNAANALAALRAIEPSLSARVLERALSEAEWPARLQRLRAGKLVDLAPARAEVWLDGGHNEDGGRVLAAAMADFEDQAQRPLVMICGTLAAKDTAGFLRHFNGLAQELLAVPIAGEHAGRSAEDVAKIAAGRRRRGRRSAERRGGLAFSGRPALVDAATHIDHRIALSRRRCAGGERDGVGLSRQRLDKTSFIL